MSLQSDRDRQSFDQSARLVPRQGGRPVRIEKARKPLQALYRLIIYLLPHRWSLVLVILFVVLSTIAGLGGPYLMGVAVDRYIASKNLAGLAQISVAMLVIFLMGNASDAASSWIMARVSQAALKRLRKELFEHIQVLPMSFFDTHPVGELMSRLTNDIEAINQAVSQNVVSLLSSVLLMAGILITMFIINLWLALASVVVVPLMLWFAEWIARYTRKGFRQLQKQLGSLNSVMEESISGQRVIKAFRRNQSVIEAFRQSNQEVYKAAVFANSYALLLMPITNQLGNLFVIAIAGLGGWLAIQGLTTVGDIITFITYARNFVNPLRQLSNIYNAIQAALAGAERVFEIIDTPPEIPDAPNAYAMPSLEGDVRFDQVYFGYNAEKPVIKNMSLEAKAGQTIALVGPTGAGKTTVANLITRFYEINKGRITIDGKDIRQIKKDDLRRQIGLVLQDNFLFSATVMENIRYGRLDATDEEVMEAARLAEADHFIRQLPQGYQTVLSERASNLSQGQRQLLAIARAILADPGILILDEATSNVDTRTEIRLQSALLRLMEGRTSFVIAHRLSTIRDADQVLVIRDGEIVERGTHTELLQQQGFYYQLYMSQFRGEPI